MTAVRTIDGRDMVPPEPLERVLDALDTLGEDETIELLLYCEPHPLYAILDRNGYVHNSEFLDDGTVVVRIGREP